jgi:hypothetical protein
MSLGFAVYKFREKQNQDYTSPSSQNSIKDSLEKKV